MKCVLGTISKPSYLLRPTSLPRGRMAKKKLFAERGTMDEGSCGETREDHKIDVMLLINIAIYSSR
jgi:hypothetical protein